MRRGRDVSRARALLQRLERVPALAHSRERRGERGDGLRAVAAAVVHEDDVAAAGVPRHAREQRLRRGRHASSGAARLRLRALERDLDRPDEVERLRRVVRPAAVVYACNDRVRRALSPPVRLLRQAAGRASRRPRGSPPTAEAGSQPARAPFAALSCTSGPLSIATCTRATSCGAVVREPATSRGPRRPPRVPSRGWSASSRVSGTQP